MNFLYYIYALKLKDFPMKLISLKLLIFIFLSVGVLYSQGEVKDPQIEIGFIEKQGEYAALDTRLINEEGDTVILGDIVNKPVLLNLVYYRCPGTCSPLMWGVSKFIEEVDLQLGEDYEVLTISFDHTEDIDLGLQKKANYISSLDNKSLGEHWKFYVSDSTNIARLTESVGFRFKWVVDQYSHPTGLIALSPEGKVTRYLRGIEFLPFDIKITMVEAAEGKIGPSINRLLAFCYSYDKDEDSMVFNITKVAGTLIMFFAVVIFLILVFMRRKQAKAS